jgi:hypothetical protein
MYFVRVMGVFIRYINNRDLAAENIMTAWIRHRFVLDCNPGGASGLVSRLRAAGLQLPVRSALRVADDLLKIRGALPGEFTVDLRQSRRYTKVFDFDHACPPAAACSECERSAYVTARVKRLLVSLGHPRRYAINRDPDDQGSCTHLMMVGGVWLNGRQYKQGCHVEYLPRVALRHNRDGPGGSEGSSTSHKVGLVHMFYTFTMMGYAASGLAKQATFAAITDCPLVSPKVRSLYFIDAPSERLYPKFRFVLTDAHSLIHVDSITAKVMVVPHFDRDLRSTQSCGIPMWRAL